MLRKPFTNFLADQWLQPYNRFVEEACVKRLADIPVLTERLIGSWAKLAATYNKECQNHLVKTLKGDRNQHYRKGKRLVIDQLNTDYISIKSVLVKSKDSVYEVLGVDLGAEKTRIKLSEIVARDLFFVIARCENSLEAIHTYITAYNEDFQLAIIDIERIHENIYDYFNDEEDLTELVDHFAFSKEDISVIEQWPYKDHPGFVMAFLRYCIGSPALRDWDEFLNYKNNFPRLEAVIEGLRPDNISEIRLGVNHSGIDSRMIFAEAEELSDLLEQEVRKHSSPFVVGGYMEVRPFYSMPAYQKSSWIGNRWRTMHMGVDIWVEPGTPVYAPLNCEVYSIYDNNIPGDYGPTVILKVQDIEADVFLLFGHLSRESLEDLEDVESLQAGEMLGRIGSYQENGGWPPHLHFQVIRSMFRHKHNFDGLADPKFYGFWKEICPNPYRFLGLDINTEAPETVEEEDDFPLKNGSTVLDVEGQKYLDFREGEGKYGYYRAAKEEKHVQKLHEEITETLMNELFSIFKVTAISELTWRIEVGRSSACLDVNSPRLYDNFAEILEEAMILTTIEEDSITVQFPHCIRQDEIEYLIDVLYKIEERCF